MHDRRRQEIVTHRVGAIFIQNGRRVRIIFELFGHLLPVLSENQSVHNDILKRRSVKKGDRENQHIVKPAACLIHTLGDEIRGEIFLKKFFILERVVELRKRHRAGLKPAVKHKRDTGHHATTSA